MDCRIPAEVILQRGLGVTCCVNVAMTEHIVCKYAESPRFNGRLYICETLIINHSLFTVSFCLS